MRTLIENLEEAKDTGGDDALAMLTALVSVAQAKARTIGGSNGKAIQAALKTANDKLDDELVKYATINSMDASEALDKKTFGLIMKIKKLR